MTWKKKVWVNYLQGYSWDGHTLAECQCINPSAGRCACGKYYEEKARVRGGLRTCCHTYGDEPHLSGCLTKEGTEMGYRGYDGDAAGLDDLLEGFTPSNVTPINRVRESAERSRRRAEEQIAKAERDIARAEARIAKLEQFPQEDDFPEETVILFYKKFHNTGTKYTYTALKVNGEWFTSGPTQAGVSRRWVDLVDFISTGPLEPEVWIVTVWERLV